VWGFTNCLGGGYYASVNINILHMEQKLESFSEDKEKEIMKAEGLEERSQEAQDAFEAGRMNGQDEVLDIEGKEGAEGLKYFRIAKALGLNNDSSMDLFKEDKIRFNIDGDDGVIIDDEVKPEEFLDLVRDMKYPPKKFNVCCWPKTVTNEAIDELIKKRNGEELQILLNLGSDDNETRETTNIIEKMRDDGKPITLGECRVRH